MSELPPPGDSTLNVLLSKLHLIVIKCDLFFVKKFKTVVVNLVI